MTLTPQQAAVLAIIERAAETGAPCPAAKDMGVALGFKRSAQASYQVRRLAEKGLLEIEDHGRMRRITIIASGKATAWAAVRPMPSPDIDGYVPRHRLDGHELDARIEADQARLRERRERHLVDEQQRYGLARRGRLIDGMVA